MNLTRMRLFKWTEYVIPIYKKYKMHITWGDQDIINIIFHYHPGGDNSMSCCQLFHIKFRVFQESFLFIHADITIGRTIVCTRAYAKLQKRMELR